MNIKLNGRYSTLGSTEGEFEPGSHHRVLKNLLAVKNKREMNIIETKAYDDVIKMAMEIYEPQHQFNINDICRLHQLWLGKIYSWAGEYRNVNMSKNGFQFASAHLIPQLMNEFEKTVLKKFTPCNFSTLEEIAESLAIVHTEYILIHPFREGNGRLGRLLSVLMGLQAGFPILDFRSIKGRKKQEYFLAVQQGLSRNYEPMRKIFLSIIKRSIKLYHS